MGVFSQVQSARPPRSAHDLSHRVLLTCDIGQLVPIMCDEMIPGEVFKVANEVVVQFNPLVSPFKHEVNVYVHYFFVPYRLIWDEWEDFITGGTDGTLEPVLPKWIPEDIPDPGTLWDYLGFPTAGQSVGLAAPYPVDFPRRAYNFIYNNYYRDETWEEDVELDNEEVLIRCYEKDYFTSALPWQQRGITPAIPLSGYAPLELTPSGQTEELIRLVMKHSGGVSAGVSGKTPGGSNVFSNTQTPTYQFTDATSPLGTLGSDVIAKLRANLGASSVGTFNVSDLRLAFQVQRFLERNARAGGRYIEFLRAQFGVAPRDERLQRPEYVGGSKQPVIVSEVLQTSSTDSTSPQGHMAGHALSAGRTFAGSYRAQEFGLMMGIMSIMPRTGYSQGINRQWLRESRYDYPMPVFANLSEQPVYGQEIYSTDSEVMNREIWGYQGRFNEKRYKPNRIAGLMKETSFNTWHLQRIFANKPNLGANFMKCLPADSKRIFAVPSQPGLICNVGNVIKAVMPLPYMPEPGLIDHY